MIDSTICALVEIVIAGYGSMVGTFGSPLVQVAIATTLVVIAAAELYVSRYLKPVTEVR
jgi:hypothetical protein